jgi:hypothetical protein
MLERKIGDGKICLAHLNGMRRDFLRDEIRTRVSLAQNGVDPSPEEAIVEILAIMPALSQWDKQWYHECIEGLGSGADSLDNQQLQHD